MPAGVQAAAPGAGWFGKACRAMRPRKTRGRSGSAPGDQSQVRGESNACDPNILPVRPKYYLHYLKTKIISRDNMVRYGTCKDSAL